MFLDPHYNIGQYAMTSVTPSQAAQIFLQPRRKSNASGALDLPGARQCNFTFEGLNLAYWIAGNGPTIFLLHGWEGSSADMMPFVQPLVSAGYAVLALDLPAHGASEGTHVSLFQCIRAVSQLLAHVGHPRAFIAHSAGCPVVVEVIRHGITTGAVVLIGSPARYQDQAIQVANQLGLDRDGTKDMLHALAAMDVDVAALNTPVAVRDIRVPGLVIHSDDDRTIPCALGKEIADAWPGAKYMPVNGLGHRRILSSPEVIAAAVDFIGEVK